MASRISRGRIFIKAPYKYKSHCSPLEVSSRKNGGSTLEIHVPSRAPKWPTTSDIYIRVSKATKLYVPTLFGSLPVRRPSTGTGWNKHREPPQSSFPGVPFVYLPLPISRYLLFIRSRARSCVLCRAFTSANIQGSSIRGSL